MTDLQKEITVIGRREFVDLPLLNLKHVESKLDTGAFTSAIHCENIQLIKEEGIEYLTFTLPHEFYPNNETQYIKLNQFTQKKIKNSFGEAEERYVIKTKILIGCKLITASFSLSDRKSMRYPILIGRKAIKGKFIIDVKQVHLNGQKLSLYLKS